MDITNLTRIGKMALLGVALACCARAVNAYDFTPSDNEWQSWPGYCKAKYVWNIVGQRSKFANLVTPDQWEQLKPWEDAGIRGVHHYCTGTIWLQRAWVEQDPHMKASMLEHALDETLFTYNGSSDRSVPQFANVAIQLARILYEQGEIERAIYELESVIVVQPKTDILYSATATMQRKLGRTKEAKETLLQGNEALEGESAEIAYNLGLICLDLGEVDEAVRYADLAYELGFPLPGLRAKLERMGKF